MPCMLCGGDDSRFLFEKMGRRLVGCRSCGLEWVDPMPTPAELSTYYERSYAEGAYSFFAEAQQVRRLIARHRLTAIADFARPGRWLDVGASSGDFVETAKLNGHDAEGLELSESACREARERGLRMHCSPIEVFEPEVRYATITAFDVLEHLLEPRSFLRKIRGWLEPQGRLVLTLPDVSSFYPRWLMGRRWFYYWPDEHLFYYSPDTLSRLLDDEGFRVARVQRAYKTMTLRYAAANLENFNASLGGVARAAVRALPEALATRAIPMYVGEMLVMAEPRPN